MEGIDQIQGKDRQQQIETHEKQKIAYTGKNKAFGE
jgi:hypothetical protein